MPSPRPRGRRPVRRRPRLLPPAERRRPILALALPIIGGMASQNLLNLVDTWMVGALGPAALAGVGLSSFLNFMAVAAITGLAAAVQALAARRHGEGRRDCTAEPLNGGLLLSLLIGLPLSALLIATAPRWYPLLVDDPAVAAEGTVYLQWRLAAVAAIGMNFSFRGYWSAIGMTRLYLYTLLVMHALNIALSWVLIFGRLGLPALGTAGAGIGTSASIVVGTLIYFSLGLRHAREAGFLRRMPDTASLRALLRLGLPNSVQQLLFAAGFTALFWIIGQIGTAELAVANVLVNLTLVAVLPCIGFGIAAATIAGQNLGRGDADAAHAGAWDTWRVSLPILLGLSAVLLLATDAVLAAFLRDPALVALGRWPLRLMAAGIPLDGLGLIMMHALLGAGASALVMRVAVGLQWLLFLPLAWLLGPVLGYGLLAIWIAMIGYRGLQALIFTAAWQRRGWAAIRL